MIFTILNIREREREREGTSRIMENTTNGRHQLSVGIDAPRGERANFANFCQKIAKFCQIFDILGKFLQDFAKFSDIRKIFTNFAEFFS